MLVSGTEQCPCVIKKCERFGKCEECIEHHKTHKKYPTPYCIRKAAREEERAARAAERSTRTNEKAVRKDKKQD